MRIRAYLRRMQGHLHANLVSKVLSELCNSHHAFYAFSLINPTLQAVEKHCSTAASHKVIIEANHHMHRLASLSCSMQDTDAPSLDSR